jgi:cysteine desulfurase / selenocysteine lyase
MSEATEFAALRRLFPGTTEWTYLDTASTCLIPTPTRDAVVGLLDGSVMNGGDKAPWVETLETARTRFARLIGAEPADVAFTKNCTEGSNAVASGLDVAAGDNVVVCGALDHPALVYPWLNQRARGLEVRIVPPTDQGIDVAAILARVDDRTRAVAASTVTFVPGFRTDLATLAEACERRGILLAVDATQSVGVIDTDVSALPLGALVTSTHKHLLSIYGQGLLWCRRDWAERMRPAHVGQHGTADPYRHPADDDRFEIELAPGARRFETGYLYAGAAALARSLEMLLDVGVDRIEAHATGLAKRLADGLAQRGLPVNHDPFGQPPSHIVTVGRLEAGELYAISDPLLSAIHDALNEARIRHSGRRGVLRFAFHLYNDASDVTRVFDVVDTVLAEQSAA